MYRVPLWNKQGILWENSKIEIAVINDVTPADEYLGAGLSIEPIGFFDITVRGGWYAMFNALGYGCYSFTKTNPDYNDAALESLTPHNKQGYRLSVAPRLKGQVGPIIAAYSLTINAVGINVPQYYLEMRSYLMHAATDIDYTHDWALLFEARSSLLIGLDYLHVVVDKSDIRSDRLQALVIILPPVKKMSELRFIGAAGMYLRDPLYRYKPYIGIQVGMDFPVSVK
jgi:hypothetical protein